MWGTILSPAWSLFQNLLLVWNQFLIWVFVNPKRSGSRGAAEVQLKSTEETRKSRDGWKYGLKPVRPGLCVCSATSAVFVQRPDPDQTHDCWIRIRIKQRAQFSSAGRRAPSLSFCCLSPHHSLPSCPPPAPFFIMSPSPPALSSSPLFHLPLPPPPSADSAGWLNGIKCSISSTGSIPLLN